MTKYIYAYHGGSMPEAPEEIAETMAAWETWFVSLGDDVVDSGNPVGQSYTVNQDKTSVDNGGSNPVSGYSLINANNIEDALDKAKGCPILNNGGTIEVAETIELS